MPHAPKSLVIAALLLALAGPAAAARTPAKTWKVNLKDADISALVTEVAEITGRNFIVDPRVKGTITVISSKALNAGEVYELFLGVLSVNGFAAIPSGNAVKLVPDVNAKQFALRVDDKGQARGEELVTRVVMLENSNATELVPVLRPMMPQFAHLAAVQAANALILSDHANNIDALVNIIRQFDAVEGSELEVITLRESRVDDVLAMLEGLMASGPAAAGGNKDARQLSRVRIVADNRGNRLLLKGDAASRQRIRDLVTTLDTPAGDRLGGVRVFRLKHAVAKQVAETLKGLVGGVAAADPAKGGAAAPASSVSLIADEGLNALVVRADPALMKEVASVIEQLDVRRSQVLIQAAIIEVSGDDAAQLGVQWAGGDPSKGVGLINFNNAGSSIASLAIAAAADDPKLATIGNGATIGIGKQETNANGDKTFYGALIQALATVSNANLLSTPSIMTLDNQEAKIVVGQNVPFITGSSTNTGAGTNNPFTTIERQDVGITLKVIPHIGEGGTVRLEVEQEVSAVVPSAEGIQSADLITNKRSIKTTILADDGQTIVLGGLIQDDVKKSVAKVPILGDIPVLGYLFRASSSSKVKRNLLVFLRPTLLRDTTSTAELSARHYENIRSLQVNVSKNGKLSRLPENIEAIYQGYKPRAAGEETTPAPTGN